MLKKRKYKYPMNNTSQKTAPRDIEENGKNRIEEGEGANEKQ